MCLVAEGRRFRKAGHRPFAGWSTAKRYVAPLRGYFPITQGGSNQFGQKGDVKAFKYDAGFCFANAYLPGDFRP
jgi:hypothetical protein